MIRAPQLIVAVSRTMLARVLLSALTLWTVSSTFVIEDEVVGSGADKLTFKVLKNTKTGEKIEVIPELGGKTQALLLHNKHGKLRDVLLTHHRNVTAIRANVGWKGAMLIPYANRIKNGSYTLNGKLKVI